VLTRKISLTVAGCLILLATSCALNSTNIKSSNAPQKSVSSSQTSQYSLQQQPDFSANILSQASLYGTSPGKIALSMLICKLDSSYAYTNLLKKNAKELFDIISETAFKKDITLESLDIRYGLCDILGSEKIYVKIESNNVISMPPTPSSSTKQSTASSKPSAGTSDTASSNYSISWIAKFQKTIIQPYVK
jgi:hypothetical protein